MTKPPNFRDNIAKTCLNCQHCGDSFNPKCKKYPNFNLRVEKWEGSVCDDWE